MQLADLKCSKLLQFVASYKKVLKELIAMVESGKKKKNIVCLQCRTQLGSVLALTLLGMAYNQTLDFSDYINILKLAFENAKNSNYLSIPKLWH